MTRAASGSTTNKARLPKALLRPIPPYEMIKNAILAGELEPAQALVETTLAEWCRVSRTPIREALRRLEQDGLVERSDRGMVVRSRSPEEILDIYDIRIVLEAGLARCAADRRTEHDLRLLRVLLDSASDLDPSDHTQMVEANQRFHRALWRAGHNEPLVDLLERLLLHLMRYPETTLAAEGRWQTATEEHRDLMDAIEKRDSKAAYAIAFQHFSEARDIRLALFAEEALSI